MIKKIGLMVLILCLILAGCAVSSGNSTAPAEKQVQPADSAHIQASVQENDNIDNNHSNNGDNPDPSQPKKDQAPASVPKQEIVEKSDISSEPAQVSSQESGKQVKLLITRDFGQEILLQELAALESGWTIMDLLQAKCSVKTRYGGGFIDSINGIKSSTGGIKGGMQDWFYYVNGICPDVGGLDYPLHAGEMIWWDYHAWQGGVSNSAVIGSFPEPFLHGYNSQLRPTTIVCSAEILEAGRRLEKSLKAHGVSKIQVVEMKEAVFDNPNGPTLVLGEWDSLQAIDHLNKLNQAYQRNGMGIHLNPNSIELLNFQGQVVKSLDGSAGVIAATGSGLGDSCPLWLVSGTDSSGFQQALELLIKGPGALAGKYSLAISGEEIIPLPVK